MEEWLKKIWGFVSPVWDWIGGIESNLSGILAIVGILTLLGGMRGWIWRQIQQQRQTRVPFDTFAFEVIAPDSDVLQAVYGGNSSNLLADRNIPYQNRIADRNTQKQLQDLLEDHHWLLITGHTGIGKTREAAELAQTYSNRGWTVLKFKETEWLDEPSYALKDKTGSDRKLLFFLDDLNKAVYRRDRWLRPASTDGNRATEVVALPAIPLQERLLQFLEHCERECRAEEIRVIATARDETEPQVEGEPSEWDKLEFEKYPFWKRFYHQPLEPPDNEAIVDLLRTTAPQVGMTIALEDCVRIADRNDRTFRNIVQNLSDAAVEQRSLSPQTFTDTLTGTWAKHYQRVIRKHPAAVYIYNAIDLLRSMRIELYPYTVAPTARLVASGNWLQHLQRRWQIHRALQYLIAAEHILQPRDGQIEAKRKLVEVGPYIPALSRLLLNWADRHPQTMQESLFGFGLEANNRQYYREALTSCNRLLKFTPGSESVWFQKGYALVKLGRYQEAIDSYDQAIAIKHNDNVAWYNKGYALVELGRYQEAIDSYDQATEIKRDDHKAWYNKGYALVELGRYQEAIDSYDQAIAIKHDFHQAWYNKACCYALWGDIEKSIEHLQQAINLDSQCRERAKTDADFDGIRKDDRFQSLISDRK